MKPGKKKEENLIVLPVVSLCSYNCVISEDLGSRVGHVQKVKENNKKRGKKGGKK
jgi:hypothetical protein